MRNWAEKLKQENPAGRTVYRQSLCQTSSKRGKLSLSPVRRGHLLKGKCMKIDIQRFGLTEVQVDPDTVFTFAEGIAGFEACKRFKLFHEEGKPTVFWLQSLDETDVMFPVVTPDLLDLEYQIELSDADLVLLGLEGSEESTKDTAVAIIVYRNDAEGGNIAANTRSPLILNLKNRQAMQKILQEVHPTLLYRAR